MKIYQRKIVGKLFSKFLLWSRPSLKDSNQITSVFFHRPNPVEFEKWLRWSLNNGYQFISTGELCQYIDSQKEIEEPTIWLSFDDGWRNNFEFILPIIRKYKIPITIFISPGLLEKGSFWLEEARNNSNLLSFSPEVLKKIPEHQRKAEMVKVRSHPDYKEQPRDFMTIEEVREISADPLVTIGNHTYNHVICTNCTEAELILEVEMAEEFIQSNCFNHFNVFAYPNGDYDIRTQNLINKLFDYIVVVDNKNIDKSTTAQAITRICLSDYLSAEENIIVMKGMRAAVKKALPIFNN